MMAIGHSHVTLYARGRRRQPTKGRRAKAPSKRPGAVVIGTAGAAVAYRFGVTIVDPRTGVRYDHSDRADIAATGIVAPRETPLTASPQALVSAIESAELRRDSHLLRDITAAVPSELVDALGSQAAIDLMSLYATVVSRRYNTAVGWAVHDPTKAEGDDRNWHGHLILPTRRLDGNGQLGQKLRDLARYTTSGREIAWIKNTWADIANEALVEAGLEVRVHVGRRLDQAPVPTVKPGVAGEERRAAKRRRRKALADVVGATLTGELQARADRLVTREVHGTALQALLLAEGSDQVHTGQARDAARARARQIRQAVRDGTTGLETARYAPQARSRREQWLERRSAVPETRPRRLDDSEQREEALPAPDVRAPEPDPAPAPARPPRKRRRRVRQTHLTAPDVAVREPVPTPPPRKRRRRVRDTLRAPEPGTTPERRATPDPKATPTELPPDRLGPIVSPAGEYVVRTRAGDAKGAANAKRAVIRALPGILRTRQMRTVATAVVFRHAAPWGVSRGSGSAETDRACDQWRHHVRNNIGSILAEMLEAMFKALERKKHQAKPTPKRVVPDDPRPRRRRPPDATTLAELEAALERVGGWTPEARAHVDHAPAPARAIADIIEERQTYVREQTARDVGTVRATGADTGADILIRHAGRRPMPPRDHAPGWADPAIERELQRSGAPAQLDRGLDHARAAWRRRRGDQRTHDALADAVRTWRHHWGEHAERILEEVSRDRTRHHEAEMRNELARRRRVARAQPDPTPEPAPAAERERSHHTDHHHHRGRGDDWGL